MSALPAGTWPRKAPNAERHETSRWPLRRAAAAWFGLSAVAWLAIINFVWATMQLVG